MTRIRRYLLIALLLIIPVQGMAAAVHAFACGADASAPAATDHGSHKHDQFAAGGHDHAPAHKHDQQSDKGAGDHQHQCCNQVSAAPIVYINSGRADLPVYQSFPSVLELTFVLEQPQRPPRA